MQNSLLCDINSKFSSGVYFLKLLFNFQKKKCISKKYIFEWVCMIT